jgi:branched-chain amino acid transport system ATP-binding protein
VTSALSVRGLSAGYGPLQVLHSIDLEVAEQERVGLVGLNGHGKSTLMRAVVGLVDWRRGSIESGGRNLMKLPTYRLAREGIVLIPQGDSLFPGLSVRDNLDAGAFAPSNWRKRAESRERVVQIFPHLGDRMKQVVGTLSGGERRMCSIARGLMAEAHIYLVDEPSLGLAPIIVDLVFEFLQKLREKDVALLLVDQYALRTLAIADHAYVLRRGELVYNGDAAGLLEGNMFEKYIGEGTS